MTTDEDKELERLKAKRLTEMQRNISYKRQQDEQNSTRNDKQKNAPTPRQILRARLGYRGLEVLENAEAQYPRETKIVVAKLAELIHSDEINEQIDGGKLLTLFRSVGLNIRMQTKINVEQDGKFVSLSEKLKRESLESGENSNDKDNY